MNNMNLRIPGPIPVPDDVLEAMSRPMINHRGAEFKEMLMRITHRLQQVFDTKEDVYLFTSSGTGAMEAAIVNTLSPGDKVLCATVGSFGDRFAEIARVFGAEVTVLKFQWGTAIDIDCLRDALLAESDMQGPEEALVSLQEPAGFNVGFRLQHDQRAIHLGGAEAGIATDPEIDVFRIVARAGGNPVPFLHLFGEAGWSEAEVNFEDEGDGGV